MEPRFVLFEIIEVYKTVTAVTLGATIITVHLATTDTLTLRFLFPCELIWFELSSFVGSIAPRLLFTVSACAPIVGLALLHVNLVASSLWNIRQDRGVEVGLVCYIRFIITRAHASHGHCCCLELAPLKRLEHILSLSKHLLLFYVFLF